MIRKSPDLIRIGILGLLLVGSITPSLGQSPGGTQAKYFSKILPDGVTIGITREDLLRTRPLVRQDDLSYGAEFYEPLPNNVFSSARYSFDGGKLSRVTLSRDGNPPLIRQLCRDAFGQLVKVFGEETSRAVGVVSNHPITGHSHSYPVAVWRRPDIGIVFSCIATEDKRGAPNSFSVSFVPGGTSPTDKIRVNLNKAATPEDIRKAFSETLQGMK
jgi:hypothetical protein